MLKTGKLLLIFALSCTVSNVYAADDITQLTGYSQLTVSDDFAAYLSKNPDVFQKMQRNTKLSQFVLSRPAVQAQLQRKQMTIDAIAALLEPKKPAQTRSSSLPIDDRAAQKARDDIAALLANGMRTDIRETAGIDIEKVVTEHKDAQENVDIAKERALLAAQERKPAAESTSPRRTAPTNPADLFANHIDINAIPQDSGLDERGWPKYLNVPAECGAPDPARTYVHKFAGHAAVLGGPRDLGREPNQHRSWVFYGSTGANPWYYGVVSQAETLAVPFHAPNVDMSGHRHDALHMMGDGFNLRTAVSKCPGDFSEHVPSPGCAMGIYNGMNRMLTKAVKPDLIEGVDHVVAGFTCYLQPGEVYYFNAFDPLCGTENVPGTGYMRPDKDGVPQPVCNHLIQPTDGWKKYASPYTGPNVTADPKPMNYRSGIQLEETFHLGGAYSYEGISYHQQQCESNHYWSQHNPGAVQNGYEEHYVCVDPEDKLPPVGFMNRCFNGQSTWPDAPIMSPKYVCGKGDVNEPQTWEIATECYRQNEGKIIGNRFVSGNNTWGYLYHMEQCQYVPEADRYMFVNIGEHPVQKAMANDPNRPLVKDPMTADINRDTCDFMGNQYPIGTKRIGRVGIYNHVSECRRVGEKRHGEALPIPVFAHVSGAPYRHLHEMQYTFE